METKSPMQLRVNSRVFIKMNIFLGNFVVRKFVKLNCKNLNSNFSECSVSSLKQTAPMIGFFASDLPIYFSL